MPSFRLKQYILAAQTTPAAIDTHLLKCYTQAVNLGRLDHSIQDDDDYIDDDGDDDGDKDYENQNGHNQANFEAKTSRFCMVIDINDTYRLYFHVKSY